MTEWISVSYKFPPENTKVLGIYAMGVYGAEILSVTWSKEGGWSAHGLGYDKPLTIVYWTQMLDVPEKWWEGKEETND